VNARTKTNCSLWSIKSPIGILTAILHLSRAYLGTINLVLNESKSAFIVAVFSPSTSPTWCNHGPARDTLVKGFIPFEQRRSSYRGTESWVLSYYPDNLVYPGNYSIRLIEGPHLCSQTNTHIHTHTNTNTRTHTHTHTSKHTNTDCCAFMLFNSMHNVLVISCVIDLVCVRT